MKDSMKDSDVSTSADVDPKNVDPKDVAPKIGPAGRLRRWRILLRLTLAGILTLLVLHLAVGWAARARLRQARERVASEGQSLSFRNFVPPDVAESENATNFLEAAGLLLAAKEQPEGEALAGELYLRLREIDSRRVAAGLEDLELFRRAVDRYNLALRILDEGMMRERARFDVPYYVSDPATLEIPNLLHRLRLSGLLRARARLAVAGDRPADAWRDVAKIFRLAGWLAEEMPTLIHAIIANTVARQGLAAVDSLMRIAPPTAGEMDLLVAEARRWDPAATFKRALQAERAAMFVSLLDDSGWETLGGNIAPLRLNLGPVPLDIDYGGVLTSWPSWNYWNAALYSDAMTEMIAACEPPAFQRQDDLSERFVELLPPRSAILAHIVLPNFSESCGRRDALVATLDLMEIAFRLEHHRREAGGYPASLDLLADLPAVDPFSGGPYRYRLDDGGAVVYSVGGNRIDDGATPPATAGTEPAPELHDGDIVWRLAPGESPRLKNGSTSPRKRSL